MRTIPVLLALLLALFSPTAVSADPAREWLDTAANPKLSLREREYAVRQVMMLADSSASILIAALRGEGSDSGLRRQVAAGILGEMAVPAAEAPLLEAAFAKDFFLAEAAASALARIYSRLDDEALRQRFAEGLPASFAGTDGTDPGDNWVRLSLDTARNRDRFRSLLMRGLALKYADAATPVPSGLTDCVWDGLLSPDADLRLHSIRVVGKTGDSRAGAKLAAFLFTENNPKLLAEALRAMGEMRPPDHGDAVERHVAHSEPLVALEALGALDAMGYPGAMFPAVRGARAVAAYASHPSTPVRRRAVELLAATKNPAALEYLQAILFDRVAMNRIAAARALGELGFTGAVGALNPLLRDGHPGVRAEAAIALSRLGIVGVASGVVDDLTTGQPAFKKAAAEALGHIGDLRAVAALVRALDDEDPELVCLATEALGRLKATAAMPRLYRLMTGVEQEWIADTARKALWAISRDDPGMTGASWKSWAARNGIR